MMTRKDFNAFADVMRTAHPEITDEKDPTQVWEACLDSIAIVCKIFNPRFDYEKFVDRAAPNGLTIDTVK